MSLLYDYSRCVGMTNWRTKAPGEPEKIARQCNDCRRREPGHLERQVYLKAPESAYNDSCPHRIGPKNGLNAEGPVVFGIGPAK